MNVFPFTACVLWVRRGRTRDLYCDSFLKSAMASISLSELCKMDIIDCLVRMLFALRMTMVLEAIPQFPRRDGGCGEQSDGQT
jgi:hypothetical protein